LITRSQNDVLQLYPSCLDQRLRNSSSNDLAAAAHLMLFTTSMCVPWLPQGRPTGCYLSQDSENLLKIGDGYGVFLALYHKAAGKTYLFPYLRF